MSRSKTVLSSMGHIFQRNRICHLTLLLLAVVSVAAEGGRSEEPEGDDAFPPLWQLAPGNLDDYPTQDNKIVINPWNYLARMGAYKILLNFTAKYFTMLGSSNADNILWGLPLQHGWQYKTGNNYYLAIIPFLGALDSGIFGELPYEVEILPPNERRADFCHSIAECNIQAPKVMSGWRDFFKYLLSTARNSETPATVLFSQDKALEYMWKAHVLSINFSLLKFQNRLPYYNGPESSFAEAWGTAVDFIAATHFSTDQNNVNHFQTGLPPRMLLEGDKTLFIRDFTFTQNTVLFLLEALCNANKKTGGILLLFWNTAMSTEKGRETGRHLIESLL
ncbi:protein LEG1 homolog isoform X2 [Elgaria multicarinata webbii]|uniref:protein LEG1 homolog isoform X2 n=1 Tax=Elgaria multicarinata webbii TaxID=159646 RepID=UPI002FCD54AC